MTGVLANGETNVDDLVGCLSKAVAKTGRPPKIVTLSAAPVANVLAHVFGADATQSLIVQTSVGSTMIVSFVNGDHAPGSPHSIDPGAFATVPRFVDAETFDRLREAFRPWLMDAAAIILQFQPSQPQIEDLASGGFAATWHALAGGRKTTIFLPSNDTLRPARDAAALVARPEPTRLVIVDPCLGRGAGHYEAYARMLTEGARDRGLSVVWACHEKLDAALAPADVEVRRCFRRCFFDLSGEQVGTVDLSAEISDGWQSILAEYDGVETHFLMHSADAHQLRAVAALFEERPPRRAVVHINFQTSPRFMPGRLAGGDVHAAVVRLRKTIAWERSLFLWAETHRLGAWLSDWLVEVAPVPPFLSAWRGVAARSKNADARIMLAFLGEGRPTKGFLDLPDIADHIAARPTLSAELLLVIQNWPPFRGNLADHEVAVARLARHPFVEIIDGVLEPPAYEALLNEADLLLLPYHPGTYGLQGSGILVEGLARGKIIVTRAETAIIDEARAGVGFAYRTPAELVEGLANIVDGFEELAAKASRLAELFRDDNTPGRFISALAARARGLAWEA